MPDQFITTTAIPAINAPTVLSMSHLGSPEPPPQTGSIPGDEPPKAPDPFIIGVAGFMRSSFSTSLL